MQFVSSRISGVKGLSVFPILFMLSVALLVFVIPVSAEMGYSQKWMGTSGWMEEKYNGTVVTDLFQKMQQGEDDEAFRVDLINQGKELLRGGNYNEAKEMFYQAGRGNSEIFDVWLGRGLAHEGLKRYQTALDSYEYAIGLSKGNKNAYAAYAGKGRSLLENQKYQDAQSAFKLAVEKFKSLGIDNSDELALLNEALADAGAKAAKQTNSSATK